MVNIIPVRAKFPNVDDEELARAVFKLAHDREQAKLHKMKREWDGRSSSGIRGVRLPDGTQMEFRIPRESYMYWAARLGAECWDDAGFVREFLRDNPQCRVKAEAVNMLSGWTPSSEKARMYRRVRSAECGVGNGGTATACRGGMEGAGVMA